MHKDLKPTILFINYGPSKVSEGVQKMINLFNRYYDGDIECEEAENQKSSDEKWLIENLKDI